MIIWVRCKDHQREPSDICARCKTAESMNQRQLLPFLAAGWTPAEVAATITRRGAVWT